MWRLIWVLLVLIVSVFIGLQIAKDPGMAFFSYRGWSVEMPLWLATLMLLGLLFIFYFFWCLFNEVGFSVYRVQNWLRWRRKYKSYSKTNRGLLELIEGHWKSAEHYLLEGIAQSDAPVVNYLGLAKAAYEQAAYERSDKYLQKAHQHAPQAEIAVGLTQANLQMHQGKYEQALATLKHLRSLAPKHGLVLKNLERIYIHLADWKSLLDLLPSLCKAKLVTSEQLLQLQQKVYGELLKTTDVRAEQINVLHEVWKSIPRKLQKDPLLVFLYAKQLLRYSGTAVEVETLLNSTLKKTWDKDLVTLYGKVATPDPKKQLAHAESWLKRKEKQEAVLFLTLARLCMRCQLWGKARSYFEDSLQLEPNVDAHAEYAELLEQLGDTSSALRQYRAGVEGG